MTHLNVFFGPVDQLNPETGYQITIEKCDGTVLLSSGQDPHTGKQLLSAADCIRVVTYYSPGCYFCASVSPEVLAMWIASGLTTCSRCGTPLAR